MLPHILRLIVVTVIITIAYACMQRPFTPEAYANQHQEQLYAMICHEGKRTISVPSEQWPEHRAHGDTRGPCRARSLAPHRKNPPPRGTVTTLDGYRERERTKLTPAEWDEREANRRFIADSIATAQ